MFLMRMKLKKARYLLRRLTELQLSRVVETLSLPMLRRNSLSQKMNPGDLLVVAVAVMHIMTMNWNEIPSAHVWIRRNSYYDFYNARILGPKIALQYCRNFAGHAVDLFSNMANALLQLLTIVQSGASPFLRYRSGDALGSSTLSCDIAASNNSSCCRSTTTPF